MRVHWRFIWFWESYALWLGGVAGGVGAFGIASLPREGMFFPLLAVVGGVIFCITGLLVVHFRAAATPAVSQLKSAGYFDVLILWGRSSAIASLLLVVVSLLGMAVSPHPFYKHILCALVGISVLGFIRWFWVVLKIDISKPATPEDSTGRRELTAD